MNADLLHIINRFSGINVLVIGDAMLDGYLGGYSDRLSREAPVPVVTITDQDYAPGGAANTAVNIRTLGGQVTFLSVIGADADGLLLRQALEARGVSTEHILAHPGRRTLAKRRVMATLQMLVRYDEGTTDPLDAATEQAVIDRLGDLFAGVDALIISDYAYGILTPRIVQALAAYQRRSPRLIMADAKHLPTYRDVGVTAVKPNYGEAIQLLGLPRLEGSCARADQIAAHAERILDLTGAQVAAVTLDSEGALIFERDSLPYRTYAQPTPNSKAAGAGDTFVGAFTLAVAAGADTPAAAELASAAATVVVSHEGTTSCSARDLIESFSVSEKFVGDPHDLAALLDLDRARCQRIVFTNGCFDILHRGHISYLNQAKALGDILVVGVNTDASVQRLKGPKRPINNLEDRVEVLSGLSSVDYVVAFDEDTPIDLIRVLRPDVFVKGGDYTRETLPEVPVVEALGGTVKLLPYLQDRSTTRLIKRIREVEITRSDDAPLSRRERVPATENRRHRVEDAGYTIQDPSHGLDGLCEAPATRRRQVDGTNGRHKTNGK